MSAMIHLLMLALAGQAAPVVTSSSMRGTILNWGTSDAIAQVTVELRNSENTSSPPAAVTVTQDNGEFVFASVPPGSYRVIATRAGYAQAEFGQKRPGGGGIPITLAPGKQQAGIQIQMTAGSTISGKVSDRSGQPLAFSRVEVLNAPSMKLVQSAITNDLGEYFAFWLAPGAYYVRARPLDTPTFGAQSLVNPNSPNTNYPVTEISPKPRARVSGPIGLGKNEAYIATYYPNTPDRQAAQLVDLHAGQVSGNVDIIAAITPALRIQGVVIDQTSGGAVNGLIQVSLIDRAAERVVQSFQFNPNNGAFEFAGVLPGTYELRASVGDLSGTVSAQLRDTDIQVSVPIRNPSSVSGRLTAENINFADLHIVLRSNGLGSQFVAPIIDSGGFKVQKVPYGDYQVYVAPFFTTKPNSSDISKPQSPIPPDTFIKSIQLGQDDVLSGDLHVTEPSIDGLQIILSTKGASLDGHAVDSQNRTIASATVVLMPRLRSSGYRLDRYKVASTDSSGRFQMRGIPPGEYSLLAWEDVDPDAWLDSNFTGIYQSFSMPLDLKDGDRSKIEIPVIPANP